MVGGTDGADCKYASKNRDISDIALLRSGKGLLRLWPDFDSRDLWAAVEQYATRERRFGTA